MASTTTSYTSPTLENKEALQDQFPTYIPKADFPERLPDQYPLYTVQHETPGPAPLPAAPQQRRWTYWTLLFAGAIFVALISGLAGGFIGKSIESKNVRASTCSTPTPTIMSSCSNATTTPNATQQLADLNKDINCPDASGQTRNSSTAAVLYKLFCRVDWIASDLVSTSAWSPDECIEACQSYNEYGTNPNRSCVGATYVPAWAVDLTQAYKRVQKASSCFLKYDIEGYPASKDTFDSVGICLLDKCPQE